VWKIHHNLKFLWFWLGRRKATGTQTELIMKVDGKLLKRKGCGNKRNLIPQLIASLWQRNRNRNHHHNPFKIIKSLWVSKSINTLCLIKTTEHTCPLSQLQISDNLPRGHH